MVKIKFGTEKNTKVIDDNGSTETVEHNFVNGELAMPQRHEYKIRKRVTGVDEEREQYFNFSRELEADPSMIDAAFIIERSTRRGTRNDWYYIVCCYTKLFY